MVPLLLPVLLLARLILVIFQIEMPTTIRLTLPPDGILDIVIEITPD